MQTFFIVVVSLLSRVLSLSVRWQRVGVQAVFAVSLLLCGGLAQAQTALVGEPYKKINQLIAAKNYAAALQAADAHLTGNPRDPQMRLIRSRVLSAQGKTDEARNQLLAITQEFPEIAEPYNNLAALYAQSGELEMARAAQAEAEALRQRVAQHGRCLPADCGRPLPQGPCATTRQPCLAGKNPCDATAFPLTRKIQKSRHLRPRTRAIVSGHRQNRQTA